MPLIVSHMARTWLTRFVGQPIGGGASACAMAHLRARREITHARGTRRGLPGACACRCKYCRNPRCESDCHGDGPITRRVRPPLSSPAISARGLSHCSAALGKTRAPLVSRGLARGCCIAHCEERVAACALPNRVAKAIWHLSIPSPFRAATFPPPTPTVLSFLQSQVFACSHSAYTSPSKRGR